VLDQDGASGFAERGEQLGHLGVDPGLVDPPVNDPEDGDAGVIDRAAGGRDAVIGTEMMPDAPPARDDAVALDDEVLDEEIEEDDEEDKAGDTRGASSSSMMAAATTSRCTIDSSASPSPKSGASSSRVNSSSICSKSSRSSEWARKDDSPPTPCSKSPLEARSRISSPGTANPL